MLVDQISGSYSLRLGTQIGTHSLTCVPVPLAVFKKGLRSCLRSSKRIAIQELAFLECVPLIDWAQPGIYLPETNGVPLDWIV